MKMQVFITSAVVATTLCLFSPRQENPVFGHDQGAHEVETAAGHRARAAQYRREAKPLQQAIHRYQIMEDLYRKGSKGNSPGFNPQGRRNMVKRVKRVIQYFTQELHEVEQQAAAEKRLAQIPHGLRAQ